MVKGRRLPKESRSSGLARWCVVSGEALSAEEEAESILSAGASGIALPGETCSIVGRDLPEQWTGPERWAWQEICEGREADFNRGLGIDLDPLKAEDDREWGDGRRTLSSDFLTSILLHEPFRSAVPNRGVRVVGAYFPQAVDLSDAVVKRPLALHGSLFDGSVTLARLKTPASVSLDGTKVQGELDMDSASVEGNLVMRKAKFAKVRLSGAQIGGQLSMDDSGFSGDLDMAAVSTGEELFMLNAEVGGDASLIYVDVGSVFDVRGAKLATLDLTGTQIARELRLGSPDVEWTGCESEVRDSGRPQLILRNVVAGALKDSASAWPGTVELDGFTYGRLDGFAASEGEPPYNRDGDWLIGWLESDRTYSPHPYRQLARVLRQAGNESRADAVLVALQDRRLTDESTPAGTKTRLFLSKVFLGYGYRVWRALLWYAGLVLVGFLVLRKSRGEWSFQGLFYSLATAVPLVDLTRASVEFSKEDRKSWEDMYFQCHKILGLLFISVLVAGLTGLVG